LRGPLAFLEAAGIQLGADVWLDVLPWIRARTPTERYAAAFSPPALHLLTDQGVEYRTVD
jgi:hypothetical protein